MRKVLWVAVAGLVGAGCGSWQHAPGYAERKTMAKEVFHAVPYRMCHSGACDKRGPSGTFDFSNVWFYDSNGAREETSFDLAYQGTHAHCTMSLNAPFACSILEPGGAHYTAELTSDCLGGTVRRDGSLDGWVLQTDQTIMLGHTAPAREVGVVDDVGPLLHLSAFGFDSLDVFSSRERPAPRALVVAAVAVEAFLQLEDLPRSCLTPSA